MTETSGARRENNVRVLIWGFGAMGGGMADMLLDKQGVEIVGVCDTAPERAGKCLFELLGRERGDRPETIVRERIGDVLAPGCADVALLATDSFTAKAYPKIRLLIENRINVISTAEQMAWPQAAEPALAEDMDRLAKANGVTVLGTGINPGLIMDLLVVLMTGACRRVDGIRARRVNSLSPFGTAVMEEQGVGLTPEEFSRRAQAGELAGHVGFEESAAMICAGLGWKLDGPVQQTMAPIVSSVPRKTAFASVAPGRVAGCDMNGVGRIGGRSRIVMEHPQQIEPQTEGVETADTIEIAGDPDIKLSIRPETPGGIGTIAMCVNMIPQVINANPGLKTMLDLPVPRAIMGDMRDRIDA